MTQIRPDTDFPLPLIEEELARFRGVKSFPPALEGAYREHSDRADVRLIFWAGVVGLVYYNAFLFNDYIVRPEVFDLVAKIRLLVVTPFCLVMLWLIRQGSPWKDQLLGSGFLVVIVGTALIHWVTLSNFSNYDSTDFVIIIVISNIAMPLRFSIASLITVVSMLIFIPEISLHPGMDPQAKMACSMTYCLTALVSLSANHRLNAANRRNFLYKLYDRVRLENAEKMQAELKQAADTDALTQIPNRRHFEEVFQRYLQGVPIGQNLKLAMLMIDVDQFKQYNDSWGHLQGDACLRELAKILTDNIRAEQDLVARLGGEEFVVLMRNADLQDAQRTSERIRLAIAQAPIADAQSGQAHPVTVSIGVALATTHKAQTLKTLLERADQALYEAKHAGRNCVHINTSVS